jgi:hypothetical protein
MGVTGVSTSMKQLRSWGYRVAAETGMVILRLMPSEASREPVRAGSTPVQPCRSLPRRMFMGTSASTLALMPASRQPVKGMAVVTVVTRQLTRPPSLTATGKYTFSGRPSTLPVMMTLALAAIT